MITIQPLLSVAGDLTDLSFVFSGGDIDFMLGLALIERVTCDAATLRYKMTLGRMVNFGVPLDVLRKHCHHDPRTLRNWARGMRSRDPDEMARVFGGRGAPAKTCDAVRRYVRRRWDELAGSCRDFRQRLASEVKQYFDVELSGEWLRQLHQEGRAAAVVEEEPPPQYPPEEMSAPLPQSVVSSAFPDSAAVEPTVAPVDVPSVPVPVASESMAESLPTAVWTRASGCSSGEIPSSPMPASSNRSPEVPPRAVPPLGSRPVGAVPELSHHVGQVLFAPFLVQALPEDPGLATASRRWLGQTLQGAANIEQTKNLCLDDLARFTGVRGLCQREQRDQLWALASSSANVPLALLAANARIVRCGPLDDDVFYYDPHTKEYTGEAPLPKGWCGRIHGVTKVIHLDCLHTRLGDPCFVQHFDNYFDLRERVLLVLECFSQLFAPGRKYGRTLVMDRGIFGIDAFANVLRRGDHLVTWEKGDARDGWQEGAATAAFSFTRCRNDTDSLLTYTVELQEAPWRRDPRFRRIVVRALNPTGVMADVAILCSDPRMCAVEAVLLMLTRWVQENDLKYLDRHCGFMQITTYAMVGYAHLNPPPPDRPADSIEFRQLATQVHEQRRLLEKNLLARENVADALKQARAVVAQSQDTELRQELERQRPQAHASADPCDLSRLRRLGALADRALQARQRQTQARRSIPRIEDRLAKLTQKIVAAKAERDRLQDSLDLVVRDDSRLRLLIQAGFQRPDLRPKAVMDCIKITARNLFIRLLELFRQHYDNRRDDHVILRQLTRSPGVLHLDHGRLVLSLWHCAELPPATRESMRTFLADLTAITNRAFPHMPTPVSIVLLHRAPTL